MRSVSVVGSKVGVSVLGVEGAGGDDVGRGTGAAVGFPGVAVGVGVGLGAGAADGLPGVALGKGVGLGTGAADGFPGVTMGDGVPEPSMYSAHDAKTSAQSSVTGAYAVGAGVGPAVVGPAVVGAGVGLEGPHCRAQPGPVGEGRRVGIARGNFGVGRCILAWVRLSLVDI